jgi:Fervidolysin N-terminal prodomain
MHRALPWQTGALLALAAATAAAAAGALTAPAAAAMGVRSAAQAPAQAPAQTPAAGPAQAPGEAAARADYVPGEVLAGFRPDVSEAALRALLAELGLALARPLGTRNAWLLRITDGSTVPQAIARLQARPEVVYAEPNYRSHVAAPGPQAPLGAPRPAPAR